MATDKKVIEFSNRIKSIKSSDDPAVNHIVAGADDIYDDEKGKKQSQVNAETDATLAEHTSTINGLNSQNYVTVTATDQTTAVTDVLPATGEVATVYRVGNWDGTQYDETCYSEYSWNGSAYVHIDTKTQIGEVFDISAYHASGGTLAKYADLSAALGTNGANIPESLRKGGMSVKYVLTSDNKYVQCRFMLSTFTDAQFADVANWIIEQAEIEDLQTKVNDLYGSETITESTKSKSGREINFSGFGFQTGDIITVTLLTDGADTHDIQVHKNDSQGSLYGHIRTVGGTLTFTLTESITSVYCYNAGANTTWSCKLSLKRVSTGRVNKLEDDVEGLQTQVQGVGQRVSSLETSVTNLSKDTIYDISVVNEGATYTLLGAALADIPVEDRVAGMTVRFIKDNTEYNEPDSYVQYRCIADEFTLDERYWQGVDRKPVENSRNLLESGELGKSVKLEHDDKFYITDKDGFVVGYFDVNGLTVTDVKLKTTTGVESIINIINSMSVANIYQDYSKCFYVCDKQGYVIFKIDNEGVHFANDMVISPFKGKVLMSLGDSLGTAGGWQSKIAELLGMTFDKTLNYNGNPDESFCVGGTQTALYPNGGFERAMRLKDYVDNGGVVDVCIIENINDMTWVGNNLTKTIIDEQITTEQPLFCEQVIEVNTGTNDYSAASTYLTTNLQTIIANITPKIGTCLYGLYETNGKKIKINSGASANGVLVVTVNGTDFNISISAGDSVSTIVNKIVEYDYSSVGVSDSKGGTGEVIMVSNNSTAITVSVNAGSTGISASVTDVTTNSGSVKLVYKSRDLSNTEWVKSSNWDELWGHSLVSIYKGLIEYLCDKLRPVQFYWFIPTRFTGTIPSTKKADGTIDYDAYVDSNRQYELLTYIQKKVCEYYCIPVIDIHHEGGINIFNQLAYYNYNGGVHPPYATYEKWGERAIKFMY